MIVQCFDALPIELVADESSSHRGGEDERHTPIIRLDGHVAVGRSSVYTSSCTPVVVKFASCPGKDKEKLELWLKNERMVYKKLGLLQRWAVPRCFGLWTWYSGKALVLSQEGKSLDDWGIKFSLLGIAERYASQFSG